MSLSESNHIAATAKDALRRAIEAAGSQKALAEGLSVSQMRVNHWLRRDKKGIPAEYVISTETLTGVPRYELRPDVFTQDGAQ